MPRPEIPEPIKYTNGNGKIGYQSVLPDGRRLWLRPSILSGSYTSYWDTACQGAMHEPAITSHRRAIRLTKLKLKAMQEERETQWRRV